MTEVEMAAAIMKRWDDAWSAASTAAIGSSVPSDKENVIVPEGTLPRASVEILDGDSEQYTIGGRAKMQRTGVVVVRLVTKPGIGRKQSDQLIGAVRSVFERRRLYQPSAPRGEDGIVLHAATPTVVKNDRDGRQARVVNVSIPFEWYETQVR